MTSVPELSPATTPNQGSRLDRAALLADLRKQVGLAEVDLAEQAARLPEVDQRLRDEYATATSARRTSATYAAWLRDQVTQSAVAWVLGTVFVRWCEDNRLIEPMLSGSGDRLEMAKDARTEFFRQPRSVDNADWIKAGFDVLRVSDAGRLLFDERHNPAYWIPLSHHGGAVVLDFWRTTSADATTLRHDFTDDSWDTRFLGDLYQDLSEAARSKYALLQTPDFVESFILDRTLTPALDEFGPAGFRLIDPTCGSGHFLISAFHRLVTAWRAEDELLDDSTVARRALDSVHGVDINPFAVAISRFRLLLAAWRVAGVSTIEQASGQRWTMTVAVGDSLLAGKRGDGTFAELDPEVGLQLASEDVHEFSDRRLLEVGSYHAVVGNPPYITVADKALSNEYRRKYSASCQGKYQLTAPFAELFFTLAKLPINSGRDAGHVGQITSNAFMKREFGTKLIEKFFPTITLTHVIDTSGAYIPGHGTPTVIIIGRNKPPRGEWVRAVMGIRGEPSQPRIPANGQVWTAVLEQIDSPGSESEWASSIDMDRSNLESHPWSLSGGGAGDLIDSIGKQSPVSFSSRVSLMGFLAVTAEDDAYLLSSYTAAARLHVIDKVSPFIAGVNLRDWTEVEPNVVVFPYASDGTEATEAESVKTHLWPNRTLLFRRRSLSGYHIDRGLPWIEYSTFHPSRWRSSYLLSFAFVATHNQFVLDRGGKVFNRSAPVIKLPADATEDDHLELLGVLNSSTACFWMKQVSQPKGGSGIGRGVQDEAWEGRYEFTSTQLEQFPLPATFPLERARRIDTFAQELTACSPRSVAEEATPTRERLAAAEGEYHHTRARMIAEQEELDWDVYLRYGLLTDKEAASVVITAPASVPELTLGERAFEIVLARKVAAGETETQWFTRHRSTPITELPAHWSPEYRAVVEARIAMIQARRDIALIERPECKRRWNTETWESQRERALREWLQDRLEDRALWFELDEQGLEQPTPRSVFQLSDRLRTDGDFVRVAQLWAAQAIEADSPDLAEVVAALVDSEHVPFLPAYRYKPAGLAKRADWEHVWDLQRQEDAIAARLDKDVTHPEVREAAKAELGTIPVPPKYVGGDFLRTSYWRARGKLDVPKERFVSYPAASLDGDGSLLLGWAGWDHREQTQALAVLISTRRSEHDWSAERVTPLLAGLVELLPWVEQWHAEIDPLYGIKPGEIYRGFLDGQLAELELAEDRVTAWRPTGRVDVSPTPKKTTKRKKATAKN